MVFRRFTSGCASNCTSIEDSLPLKSCPFCVFGVLIALRGHILTLAVGDDENGAVESTMLFAKKDDDFWRDGILLITLMMLITLVTPTLTRNDMYWLSTSQKAP